MRLTVVVVTYDARDLLLHCLDAVDRALEAVTGGVEVLVVDNASTDGTAAAVREQHPRVRLLEPHANLGFPAAVNLAVAGSSGEWLLLLNNDTVVAPMAVRRALEVATAAPADVGSLALLMRFAHDGRINSAGLDVDGLGVAFDRLIGAPLEAAGLEVGEVFGASGGAALLRRSMLTELGGFDATFFLYLEDVDLAWRARMGGWRCLLVPDAVVLHHHSASSGHASPFKHFHVGRNRIRLLAKNMPGRILLRRMPAILGYEVGYILAALLRDRTIAPIRGRLTGLREWRRYRRAGAGRAPVPLAPVQGLRGARRRATAVERGSIRPGVSS